MTPEFAVGHLGWVGRDWTSEQRREVHETLVAHGTPSIAMALDEAVRCPTSDVMHDAASVIADVCANVGLDPLFAEVGRPNGYARSIVAMALGRMDLPSEERRLAALEILILDSVAGVRDDASNSIVRFGKRGLPALRRALEAESEGWLRGYLRDLLAEIEPC